MLLKLAASRRQIKPNDDKIQQPYNVWLAEALQKYCSNYILAASQPISSKCALASNPRPLMASTRRGICSQCMHAVQQHNEVLRGLASVCCSIHSQQLRGIPGWQGMQLLMTQAARHARSLPCPTHSAPQDCLPMLLSHPRVPCHGKCNTWQQQHWTRPCSCYQLQDQIFLRSH